MRTVFLGTSDFAVAVLRRLVASEHRPALVVTRPDRPRGRGRRVASPPVAVAARELGVELLQPESVNDAVARERIAAVAPGAVCVCGFGALIKEPLLSEHLMLNVHPSLLPRWRGAAPIERAIMAGDPETGVSIMRVAAGLDSGPVCLQATEPIRPDDTYGSLAPRLEALGGDLLVAALDTSPPFVDQDEAAATYADKIGARDRTLDPARPAIELERTVRALHPHIGARLPLPEGGWLGIHAAAVAEAEGLPPGGEAVEGQAEGLPPGGEAVEGQAEGLPPGGEAVEGQTDRFPPPGELAARDGRLLFGCADGALELRVVQPPGGRPMDAAAYLRGHRVLGG